MPFVHVGFGHWLNPDRVVAIIAQPRSNPVLRMIQARREAGMLLDLTSGRRTLGVVVTDTNQVVLVALQPETVAARAQGRDGGLDEH